MFPQGFEEEILELWERVSGQAGARLALVEHHLLSIGDGRVSMLPPVARYALGRWDGEACPIHCFDWPRARDLAYACFIELSAHASDIASTEEARHSRANTVRHLWAIDRLVENDLAMGKPNKDLLGRLHHQLRNVYSFSTLAGKNLLKNIKQILGDALSWRLLGNMEARLGNLEQARDSYDQAIELYKNEHNQLGLANALRALGALEIRLGNLKTARDDYDKAIELYKKEKSQLGRANALQRLGRLIRGCQVKCVTIFKQGLFFQTE